MTNAPRRAILVAEERPAFIRADFSKSISYFSRPRKRVKTHPASHTPRRVRFFMPGLRSSPAIDSFLRPLTRRRASCKIMLKILWGEPFEPGTDRAAALRPSAGPIRLDRDGRAGIFRAHPPRLRAGMPYVWKNLGLSSGSWFCRRMSKALSSI